MSNFRQGDSLEDQLREEDRLAAAMRRRRRRRWLIPLICIFLALCILFLILYFLNKPEPSLTPEPTEPAERRITILAAGDVCLNAQMMTQARTANGYDFSDFFLPITRDVAAADLAIVNVEGTFCGEPYNVVQANYPESLLTALATCGFDVVQTANSYSIENGLTGLVSTKQFIQAQGLDALGTFTSRDDRQQSGGILIKEVGGVRIALIGLTKGTNGLRLPAGAEYSVNLLFRDYDTNYSDVDKDAILALLDAAREARPDLIICMVHWGSEYSSEISDAQKKIANLLLDNGADAIIGTHPHRVGLIEWKDFPTLERYHETGVVAYSIGDLLSSADREDAHQGCMLRLTVTKEDGVAKISDVSYLPVYSAYPSESLGQERFTVYDTRNAISLYESSHYDRVSRALYQELLEAMEDMKEATGSELLAEGE